jgi:hypothetical protein
VAVGTAVGVAVAPGDGVALAPAVGVAVAPGEGVAVAGGGVGVGPVPRFTLTSTTALFFALSLTVTTHRPTFFSGVTSIFALGPFAEFAEILMRLVHDFAILNFPLYFASLIVNDFACDAPSAVNAIVAGFTLSFDFAFAIASDWIAEASVSATPDATAPRFDASVTAV